MTWALTFKMDYYNYYYYYYNYDYGVGYSTLVSSLEDYSEYDPVCT